MNYRKLLIKVFTFLGGFYFFIEFILPADVGIDRYHDQITNGFTAIGAMALGLGLINLLSLHGARIVFKRQGWFNSFALLFGLALMLFVTAKDWLATMEVAKRSEELSQLADFSLVIKSDYQAKKEGVPPIDLRTEKLVQTINEKLSDGGELLKPITLSSENLAGYDELSKVLYQRSQTIRGELSAQYEASVIKKLYSVLYDGLFVALGSAMFSLLGFYMASAAYRAFRIRSTESALMMMAALLVMLGQIPFGLWLWDGFPEVRLWLLTTPSTGVFRAIKIGAAVAGLIMAFRMWLSIESETFEGR